MLEYVEQFSASDYEINLNLKITKIKTIPKNGIIRNFNILKINRQFLYPVK